MIINCLITKYNTIRIDPGACIEHSTLEDIFLKVTFQDIWDTSLKLGCKIRFNDEDWITIDNIDIKNALIQIPPELLNTPGVLSIIVYGYNINGESIQTTPESIIYCI